MLQVLAGKVLHILADLIRHNMAGRAHNKCRSNRQGTGARACLEQRAARAESQADQDETDVLRIQDLRRPRQIQEEIGQGWLQQEKRRAEMAENLSPPRLANQVIVQQNAAVRLEL